MQRLPTNFGLAYLKECKWGNEKEEKEMYQCVDRPLAICSDAEKKPHVC